MASLGLCLTRRVVVCPGDLPHWRRNNRLLGLCLTRWRTRLTFDGVFWKDSSVGIVLAGLLVAAQLLQAAVISFASVARSVGKFLLEGGPPLIQERDLWQPLAMLQGGT